MSQSLVRSERTSERFSRSNAPGIGDIADVGLALAAFIRMLPEAVISAMIEQLISELDARHGDSEAEDDSEDCCEAGDDGICAGTAYDKGSAAGSELLVVLERTFEDLEIEVWPTIGAQTSMAA